MSLPGFTAERSIYQTRVQYRAAGDSRAGMTGVTPQQNLGQIFGPGTSWRAWDMTVGGARLRCTQVSGQSPVCWFLSDPFDR